MTAPEGSDEPVLTPGPPLQAFGRGEHGSAAELLRDARSQAHRFGDSAQRDLVDLTLLEAALRSGQRSLALGLAAECKALRTNSAWVQRQLRRAQGMPTAP
jgi:hypothetical protein